jgi:Zn-dependent protease with chaperone function
MDFFERQDQARRKTKLLVFYFISAVVTIIALVYVAAVLIFAGAKSHHHSHYYESDDQSAAVSWWDPNVFLGATCGVLAVIFLGSAYKTSELSSGGSAVAELMGGRLVSPNSTESNERKLLNVVEEMSIASGVPMPKVYVMDEERAINAFAAGHSTSDAAVTVSRGCMELLTRDELQGVVGHEFSHILNGDMRLNLKLIGVIFGLLCLATIGRVLLYARGGGGRGRGNNALPLFGIVLIVLGAAGVFFGRLIQAAISRQREFLADASSVQFTRNPAGLSGALQKIGSYSLGSKLGSEHAPDLCHMFFGNGLGEPVFEPWATHPPLAARIRAIDPNWDGKFPPFRAPQVGDEPPVRSGSRHAPPLPNVLGTILGGAVLDQGGDGSSPATSQTPDQPPVIQSGAVMPNLGTPTPQHLEYAEKLRGSLPESIQSAARQPLPAAALIYALLLSPEDSARAGQLEELAGKIEPTTCETLETLYPDVAATAAHARLPMVNLALGGLRGLTEQQYVVFAEAMDWLTKSDGKIELFEIVLQKIILRHLSPQFGYGTKTRVQYYALKPLLPDCAVVLSALANVSSGDPAEVHQAFNSGRAALTTTGDAEVSLLASDQCGINEIDAALTRLALALPVIKKALLTACVQVVGADGVILETEAELLRAIADTLDCPMPPFIVE